MTPRAAFLPALIGAPLLVAAIGLLMIQFELGLGVFLLGSAMFGAPSYLLAGAPFLLYGVGRGWSVGQGWRSVLRSAALGFAANLASAPVIGLMILSGGRPVDEALSSARFIAGFGLFFAPFYGAVFGLLFWALTRGQAAAPSSAPAWTADPRALLRTTAALLAATYACAALRYAATPPVAEPGYGAPTPWADAILASMPLAVAGAPVLLGLRLLAPRLRGVRALAVYAAAGLVVEPLATWLRAGAPVGPDFQIALFASPLAWALAAGFLPLARLLAGSAPRD